MKHYNLKKKLLSLFLLSLLILSSLFINGCAKTPTEDPATPPVSEQPTPGGQEDPDLSDSSFFPDYNFSDNEVTFQGYNAASDTTETYTFFIQDSEKTTLNTILVAYNELYVVPILKGTPITANSIVLEDKALKIDFSNTIYGNYGSGTEAALLDNLFLAFFDNVSEVEEIYISVEGGPYETGHIMFNTDEAIKKSDLQ